MAMADLSDESLCQRAGSMMSTFANGQDAGLDPSDVVDLLRDLVSRITALREQVRKNAAEIGGLRAAVEQLGGTFGGDTPINKEGFSVGDRVVFRHPNCRFTSSDRGVVEAVNPLTVKWDGDIRSRPNPKYVFPEIGPLPTGEAK